MSAGPPPPPPPPPTAAAGIYKGCKLVGHDVTPSAAA